MRTIAGSVLVNKLMTPVLVLWTVLMTGMAEAAYPVYADGDLAPLDAPDGLVNIADYLLASRIVLGVATPGRVPW
jgi:hypothetical protein